MKNLTILGDSGQVGGRPFRTRGETGLKGGAMRQTQQLPTQSSRGAARGFGARDPGRSARARTPRLSPVSPRTPRPVPGGRGPSCGSRPHRGSLLSPRAASSRSPGLPRRRPPRDVATLGSRRRGARGREPAALAEGCGGRGERRAPAPPPPPPPPGTRHQARPPGEGGGTCLRRAAKGERPPQAASASASCLRRLRAGRPRAATPALPAASWPGPGACGRRSQWERGDGHGAGLAGRWSQWERGDGWGAGLAL